MRGDPPELRAPPGVTTTLDAVPTGRPTNQHATRQLKRRSRGESDSTCFSAAADSPVSVDPSQEPQGRSAMQNSLRPVGGASAIAKHRWECHPRAALPPALARCSQHSELILDLSDDPSASRTWRASASDRRHLCALRGNRSQPHSRRATGVGSVMPARRCGAGTRAGNRETVALGLSLARTSRGEVLRADAAYVVPTIPAAHGQNALRPRDHATRALANASEPSRIA